MIYSPCHFLYCLKHFFCYLFTVIISFSCPVNIDLSSEIIHFGRKWEYKSHVQETSGAPTPYFANNKTMMFQNTNGKIFKELFGLNLRVKMVAFACSSKFEQEEFIRPVYDAKVQLYLRKQYNSVVNPELNEQNQQKTKLYEQKYFSGDFALKHHSNLNSPKKILFHKGGALK